MQLIECNIESPHRRRRGGRMNLMWLLLLGAAILITLLVFLMRAGTTRSTADRDSLIVYAAAGMRVPMEEIVESYQAKYGIDIEIQYNGSNTLLNQLQADEFSRADVYLAADDFYTTKAISLGLAVDTIPVAHQRPVIAVNRSSDKNITSIKDLLQDDIRVAVANPEAAAVGKAARRQLSPIMDGDKSLWDRLAEHVTSSGVFKPTVNDIATDVMIGTVDAAIVWDSTVAMPRYRKDLKAVVVPELSGDPDLISIAVLKSSTDLPSAYRFARFVAARDQGLQTFEKFGTQAVDGDVWAEEPQISFFCGAVNRRTTEKIIEQFQREEGVVVNTIYDGCGILTSRMKGIEAQSQAHGFPDVYMACDLHYLENVKTWFQEAVSVSDVDLVIAVPKGSTRVKSLADLVKPDVRVAIGEPSQCTIGVLTRRLLEEEGLYEQLLEKQQGDSVVVQKSSSAHLVPDVVTGHVDAAVAYISDVLPNTDDVDYIRIESPLSVAIQPISIARTSDHKYLLRRLLRRIEQSPDAFESVGFRFRLGSDSSGDMASPQQ